jgi:transcriptional regulator with XRE-family HTH domain
MDSISTPLELAEMLGENLKALRLQKNLDRRTLSLQAGISENAIRHLEGGKGATLKTLICVVKALDRESWFASIAPVVSINPLYMIRDKHTRQRASRKKYGKSK